MQKKITTISLICASLIASVCGPRSAAMAAYLDVAPTGAAYTNIQDAIDAAQPGDTVRVETGIYNEQLIFPTNGNDAGWITVEAHAGHAPVLDGSGFSGGHMVLLRERTHIRIQGLEIRDLTNVTDSSGIRLEGACCCIQLVSNTIHDLRGTSAMGITVYGTNAVPASNIVIRGNHIYDCEPADSEALVLNGNITDFEVSDNRVHHVNNIGIDFIGGETDISLYGICRNGVCRGNYVSHCRSSYGGGYAAGIYVDGAQNILIEENFVHACDLGIEIGAENAGYDTTGITVRANTVFKNDKVGLIFGGYDASVGRARGCRFINNVTYHNDTLGTGNGELWIQWSSNNIIENNIFFASEQAVLLTSWETANRDNQLDYNLWMTAAGNPGDVSFVWNETEYTTFTGYVDAVTQDVHSTWGEPLFLDVEATNLHVAVTSIVIDAGSPAYSAKLDDKDIDGESRVMGEQIDIGIDEVSYYWAWRETAFGGLADFTTNRHAAIYSPGYDYDGDGIANYGEMLGQSDPRVSTSVYRIAISADDSNIVILFAVAAGQAYTVERLPHTFAPSNWQTAQPFFIPQGYDDRYAVTNGTTGRHSWYRVGIRE